MRAALAGVRHLLVIPPFVIPAKAGIQTGTAALAALDSRLRGNDDGGA